MKSFWSSSFEFESQFVFTKNWWCLPLPGTSATVIKWFFKFSDSASVVFKPSFGIKLFPLLQQGLELLFLLFILKYQCWPQCWWIHGGLHVCVRLVGSKKMAQGTCTPHPGSFLPCKDKQKTCQRLPCQQDTVSKLKREWEGGTSRELAGECIFCKGHFLCCDHSIFHLSSPKKILHKAYTLLKCQSLQD